MARIVIRKRERTLTFFGDNGETRSFPVALGSCPEGRKRREGDGRTPEGRYFVCTRNDKSKYYLSLGLSYPNEEDARLGLEEGTIDEAQYAAAAQAQALRRRPPWDTALGGFVMIHGGGVSRGDWTAGCAALENEAMDYLWPRCPLGTEVEILP